MLYLPVGLAPRLRGWPWMSLIIAGAFFVISFLGGPQILRFQERVKKTHEALRTPSTSKFGSAAALMQKRQEAWFKVMTQDPKLKPWIFQHGKGNKDYVWINPWIIPQFSVMVLVCVFIAFFGGFIEKRLGGFLFGIGFVGLYYLGYLAESFLFFPKSGVTAGGSAALYILAGAYFAIFPLRDICVWGSNNLRPLFHLPVWIVACLGLIALESFGVGGYVHAAGGMSYGYFHFAILILSYFVFLFFGSVQYLPDKFLSVAEFGLSKKLSTSKGAASLPIMKELLQINPSHLEPLHIYYNRVIAPLGKEPISPENQKFLDQYLAHLICHHYDHQDYAKISELLKGRPTALMPSSFFKLLLPKEWLDLGRQLDRRGEWMEALRLYATMLEYFQDARVRGEAIKRAEVVIHRTFKEAIERHSARRPIFQQAKSFLADYPSSKVSKIFLDHYEHFKKVTKSEEGVA